ncbi:hypothetical protein ACLKMY_40160 [Paraburkholderia mimosarum]|uniref:hypothetical protein n=1 Tax=Paraburkholderia mimosarum TaxID=312026 RepID=UPI000418858A|nr:hypothetical protein [Paraburkholderia mimosarum]
MILALVSRRAPLLRSLINARSGFLDGLSTYLLKLGPHNLPPPFNNEIDREFAASPHVAAMRLRLQQVACLLAQSLMPELDTNGAAPLHLINFGGGTAIDSINTLILLNQTRHDAPRDAASRSPSSTWTVMVRNLVPRRCGYSVPKGLRLPACT